MFTNPGLASGWLDARGEHAHGCGFSRAVWPEQAENFPRPDIERDSIERNNFWLRLLALAALFGKRKSAGAGRERWCRVIDFAQFAGADAGRHRSNPLSCT